MLKLPAPEFRPKELKSGKHHHLSLQIPGWADLELATQVIRGARPGKTLLLIASVHGDEYEGVRAIMEVCVAAGGSITGEHGVGSDKVEYMTMLFDDTTLGAMCDVRRVFDPDGRANPGKVVPVHSCREWRAGGIE